ncbi:MAG TPA: CU044_5270 family protein [Solirubrobacteraceae bacterium]
MAGEHPLDPATRDEPAGDPPRAPSRPDAHSRPRRLQNLLIAIALLAEFVALIGHPLFGWGPTRATYAATPAPLTLSPPLPPSGAAVLIRLAAVAAQRSGLVGAPHGTYAYVKRETWQLAPQRSGHAPPSVVVPVIIESWRDLGGGTGRVVTLARDPRIKTGTPRVSAPSGAALPALAITAVALVRRLQAAAPAGAGPATGFLGLAGLTADQPVPPEAQAAILRLLARAPGVINSGTVTDRAGRPGVAVSVDSAGSGQLVRTTLVFAAATGALLEADQTLVGDPQRSDVQQGAVLAYTTFLAAGDVGSVTARP